MNTVKKRSLGGGARIAAGLFMGAVSLVAFPRWEGVTENAGDVVRAPARARACHINPAKELVITDLSVVDDSRAQGLGPWTFGKLMSDIAPPRVQGATFVDAFFRVWIHSARTDETDFLNIDGAASPSEEAAQIRADHIESFLDKWPVLSDGQLDLANAPFRLAAIVNRLDEGEGRFVFVFVDEFGAALDCTIIFEYKLPTTGPNGEALTLDWWAAEWHKLGAMQLGSPEYLAQLEKLTSLFSSRNAAPDGVNGSSIGQVRVNEQLSDTSPGGVGFEVVPVWQLREFHLDPRTGLLAVSTVAGNPHLDYNTYHDDDHPEANIEALTDYILSNKDDLLAGTFVYDSTIMQEGITAPLRGQAFSWLQSEPVPPGISEEEWDQARKAFSNTTCNGCHGYDDGYWIEYPNPIDHAFTHISMREENEQATVSQFLKDDMMAVRIPNMLSYVCPEDSRAKRVDPFLRPVH